MRMRRAQELEMQRAFHRDVIDELAEPPQQRVVLDARHRLAAAETGGMR
jgi:hypothetical protein